MIEFTSKESLTPLLLAAKYNNLNCVAILYEEGANIYAVDTKM